MEPESGVENGFRLARERLAAAAESEIDPFVFVLADLISRRDQIDRAILAIEIARDIIFFPGAREPPEQGWIGEFKNSA